MSVAQILLCGFVGFLVIGWAFLAVYHFYGKGRKVKITVLYKRKVIYNSLRQVTRSNCVSERYTIDCTYGSSKKIHTLGCGYGTFEQLKKGKSYIVTIKMQEIVKIHNKNKKTHKK